VWRKAHSQLPSGFDTVLHPEISKKPSHMTTALHTSMPLSHSEPSFFELYMTDRLHRALVPAIRHGLRFLAHHELLPGGQAHEDGFGLAAVLVLQMHSLWTSDALIAERLYGLRRCVLERSESPDLRLPDARRGCGPVGNSDASGSSRRTSSIQEVGPSAAYSNSSGNSPRRWQRPLHDSDRVHTLLLEVLLPYFKLKLDKAYTIAKNRRSHDPPEAHSSATSQPLIHPGTGCIFWCRVRSGLRESFESLLLYLYPLLHLSYEGSTLFAQLLYLVRGLRNSSERNWSPVRFHASQYPFDLKRAAAEVGALALSSSATAFLPAFDFATFLARLGRIGAVMFGADLPVTSSKPTEVSTRSSRTGVSLLRGVLRNGRLGLDQVFIRRSMQSSLQSAGANCAAPLTSPPSGPATITAVTGGNATRADRHHFLMCYTLAGAVVAFKALQWWNPPGAANAPVTSIAVPAQRNQQQRESNAHELHHRWRWWHNARDAGVGNSRLRSNTSEGGVPLEVPPPPFPSLAVPPMYGGVALSLASSICPICLRPQQNAAASPSGFVFCYRCLVARVVELERCPITHVPCKEDDIRRLFGYSSESRGIFGGAT
jgi:hypothetical protein